MRLIDADALIGYSFKNPISYNAFVNLVKRQPTVDAVQVVRCGECKCFENENFPNGCGWCDKLGRVTFDDWYCADGERLEEDDLRTSANHYGERREEDDLPTSANHYGGRREEDGND